MAMLMLV